MATAAITITLDPDDKTMSQGYRVVLLDGGNEIKDYSAGGNPHELEWFAEEQGIT